MRKLLVLLSAIALGIAYLISTPQGLQWSLKLAQHYLPTLHIAKAEGQLIGPVSLENVTFKSNTTTITLKKLRLDWLPQQLFLGHVNITALSLEKPVISYRETTPAKTSASSSDPFPLTFHVDALKVHHLRFQLLSPAGKLQGRLHLDADYNAQKPQLILNASVPFLHWTQYHLKDLNIQGSLNDKKAIALEGVLTSLKTKTSELNNVKLHFDGTLQKHHLGLQATIADQNIQLSANGEKKSSHYLLTLLPSTLIGAPCQHCTFQGEFTIIHALHHPDINGSIALDDGAVKLHQLGLNLQNMIAKVTIKQSNAIHFSAHLKSGEGQLALTGDTHLVKHDYPTTVVLKGDNVEVINNPMAQAAISPDLTVVYHQQALDVVGKISVPNANIHPVDFSSTEAPSSDIVYANAPPKKAGLAVTSQLALHIGPDVKVRAYGLNGKLAGDLAVTQQPKQEATGDGQLNVVDGTYTVFGQTLDIKTGQLIFSGPVSNPALNINASKTIKVMSSSGSGLNPMAGRTASSLSDPQQQTNMTPDQWEVGVNVSGPLTKPKPRFYSHPSGLTQADILSLLLTGIPASQLSKAQGQLLFQAASSLGAGGGELTRLKSEFQHRLGIDVGFSSEQYFDPHKNTVTQNPAIVLSKYLTPKLYVNYSIGVLDPVNTFRMNYLLGKGWSAQTETNVIASGFDFMYRFGVK